MRTEVAGGPGAPARRCAFLRHPELDRNANAVALVDAPVFGGRNHLSPLLPHEIGVYGWEAIERPIANFLKIR